MKKCVKWYNNGIKEIKISTEEKIPDGFIKGRLPKVKLVDKLSEKISKEKLYKDYIIDNKSFKELLDLYCLRPCELRPLISYYNIRKDLHQARKNNKYQRSEEEIRLVALKSSETQKASWQNKSDEEKKQWSDKCKEAQAKVSVDTKKEKAKKYLLWWNSLSDSERFEINQKRSNSEKKTWEENHDVMQSKRKSTEKENRKNRLCRSVAEQKVFDFLSTIFPDVVYDIKVDGRYPFYCDFYIPSKDLFIELNAHPSHGKLPIKYLTFDDYSKYPTKWVDVFCRRDVEKQKYASKNKLNYIMIYPAATLQENININENSDVKLIEKLYLTQK